MKYIAIAVAALASIRGVSARLALGGDPPITERELERFECGESKQLICQCTPNSENCETLCVSGNEAKQSNGDGDSGAMVTPGACADKTDNTALELVSDLEDQLAITLDRLADTLARNEDLEAEVKYKAQLASALEEIEDLRFAVGFLHSQLTGVNDICSCSWDIQPPPPISELSKYPNDHYDLARIEELEEESLELKDAASSLRHDHEQCTCIQRQMQEILDTDPCVCPPYAIAPIVGIDGGPNPSDKRFKKNITPISDPMALIKQLNGVTWNWKTDEFPDRNFDDKVQIGFIAQELEEILPDTVLTNKSDGYKSVYYTQLIALLAEGIKTMDKEYNTQFNEMKEEIKLLKMERQAV